MKSIYLSILSFIFAGISLFANTNSLGQLQSFELKKTYSKEELKSTWKKYKIPKSVVPIRYEVDVYEVLYTTQWHDGTEINASGVVFVPRNTKKDSPMICYNHGTRIKKTRGLGIEDGEQAICIGFAVDGYIVAFPDYIGLGKGEKFHLYQHADTEAKASVDMIRATKSLLEKISVSTNGQLYLTGYSQGGHASMATHRYIQEQLSEEMKVTASSPMSGAYDLSGAQSHVMFNTYTHPGYLPYLLNSYHEVYDLLPGDIYQIYKFPYDTVIRHFYNGQYEMGEINPYLPAVPIEMIKEEFVTEFTTNPDFPFFEAIRQNNLYDWKPESPMQLCFCKGDEQVTYKNAIVAYETMKKNGSKYVKLRHAGKKFNHYKCAIYTSMYSKLFFDSIRNGSKKGTRGNAFKRMLIGMGKMVDSGK
ncbi:MAG: hypothetical protein IAE67_09495 [Candidatus Competibacteraceae bacterium]|nr:hypothetical protein [Candidatus Competibacteraceae bacterium]